MNEDIFSRAEKYSGRFTGMEAEKGCLHIVSTPIGNLEEISFRALAILRSSDIIACEDTRRSGMLMKSYGIGARLMSYYSATEGRKSDQIIRLLKDGRSCSLISDAGTPTISDPGATLVSKCIEEGIPVKTVPGSNSVIHALVVSGFMIRSFYFQGFLPQKKGRAGVIEELKSMKTLLVIFESPYRIRKTLRELSLQFGSKKASLSRELTKKFEQTIHGNLREISDAKFREKGEFVLIINNA